MRWEGKTHSVLYSPAPAAWFGPARPCSLCLFPPGFPGPGEVPGCPRKQSLTELRLKELASCACPDGGASTARSCLPPGHWNPLHLLPSTICGGGLGTTFAQAGKQRLGWAGGTYTTRVRLAGVRATRVIPTPRALRARQSHPSGPVCRGVAPSSLAVLFR